MSQNAATTFGALTKQWLSTKSLLVKESTYIKYQNLIQHYILPRIGSIPIEDITSEILSGHCSWLLSEAGKNGQGVSAKTASDTFFIIRSVLRMAKLNHIPVQTEGTEITLHVPQKQLQILSCAHQQKLSRYLTSNLSQNNIGILICLYTGMRLGEICALRWEDVSPSDKTIYVHQTMQRLQLKNPQSCEKKTSVVVAAPKTPCSVRFIPILPELSGYVEEFRSGYGYVLTGNETFMEPRTMENHFKRALKNAGIPDVNFHCLRHTFATRCVEVGFDVKTLSEILGHSSTTITMNRYVHPTMQMKRENMQKLSTVFFAE